MDVLTDGRLPLTGDEESDTTAEGAIQLASFHLHTRYTKLESQL